MKRTAVMSLMPESARRRMPSRGVLASAVAVGALMVATLALWARFGTAVFFETISAGFAACF
jgi:hypothetical protein